MAASALAAAWIMVFRLFRPSMCMPAALIGSHVTRQTPMLEDNVIVQSEAGQDHRILPLEAAGRLLPQPNGVAVERLHLVVVRVACHVDVSDVLGILVEEVLGGVLLFVGVPEVCGAVRDWPPWDLSGDCLAGA